MPIKRLHFDSLLALAVALAGASALRGDPIISEFMAANTTTLADEDGAFSDWIEVFNPDPVAVNLNGWYLTDSATNKTKWQFPAVTLSPGGYLVVFASDKNRRDPAGRLHTNFALDADGEYLALVKADGTSVASEFSPKFPKQRDNVSFGYAPGTPRGSPVFLSKPTPGAANSGASPVGIPETVTFSQAAGPFRSPFSLTLSGAGSGQQIRYVIAPASAGSTAPEPTATSTLYSGPITITTSVVVRAVLFSSDGKTRGATRTVYYPVISPALSGFTSILPVIVIDSLGSGPLVKDGVDHTSWLYAYAPRSNNTPVFSTAPDLISPLTSTVRGATSAEFPKKGYNIAFSDEFGGGRSPALLDLPEQEQWALVAPWKYDLTFFNNAFVYALSNRIGRWAPRTRLAEIYFNSNGNEIDGGDYAGIYVITDRVEVGKNRVDLATLSPDELSGSDVTGGYILKIDAKDPDEIGWVTSRGIPNTWSSSIVLVSPAADAIAPTQLAYIKDYVQRMENALFASRDAGWAQRSYLDYIDRAAWVDHHLLNTFVANPDAFQRSAYFSKDRKGRLVAGPVWDFDRALGSYWDERSFRYDVWAGLGAADVWQSGWWGVIARDPEFMQDWVDRWQTLRRAEFATSSLVALVDSLAASVGAAAAARDVVRWPDDASPYGSYAAQIEHQKGWITQRAEWIDRQFLAAPSITSSGNSLIFVPPAGAQLAYTLDGSDPRALGGAVAPNAILTSAALTTPASANVHVRSYNASLRGVFPGSPWSSAAGGASSSPLTPAARLVNISSRAAVGAGENALIAGVVVADTEAKRYLSRAIGPALAVYGVSDFVPDPQLGVFGGSTELFRNNGWESGPDAPKLPSYAKSVGAFALPAGSRDSALANEFAAGAYTVQITTPSARSGVGLAELYELDANGRTVNLSTRAQVRTGDGVLIGGFVVQGPAYKRMLIRAVGPTLGSFGVTGALRDPILTVYAGSNVVATNDRWESAANAAAIGAAGQSAGAFSLTAGSEDAALLITLAPGAYTVKVEGKGGGEGIALLEIYEIP
jgi:hypothetical protein